MKMKAMKDFILFFLIGILSMSFYSCSSEEERLLGRVSKIVEIDITEGEIIDYVETHGGFLGDGSTYIEIHFSEEETALLLEKIIVSSSWNELPTSDELNIALYGGKIEDMNWSSLVEDETHGIPALPYIYNGYYFFENRNYAASGSRNESTIFDSYSFNFTVALFDINNYRIYFFVFDT